MSAFTPQNLFQAIRESGLYKPEQLAALDHFSPELVADLPALAERLSTDKLVTSYQGRKVRLNRLHEVLIGPYLVLDKIGEGGMGKVYKAVRTGTGRLVALKVVRAHLMTNPTVLRRYKREAAAAAKLNHPNIVALLDADEAQGRYYLALEFVYGSDLSRMVKEFGPLPSSEAAEYIRQAALGLQHAHENNLIHRDIKPSNVLVSGERAQPGTGGVATVRILDMGLVRSLEDSPDTTEVTRDGTVVGTPDYMAPEQAKNSSTVDHRADIYGLGCTLYYLLKGRPPFPDGSPIDKLLRHQLDPPPDLRKERPDVPFEMLRLMERMLAKKPDDRIQTAAEVAKGLAPFTAEGLANTPDIVLTLPEPVAAVPARALAIPEGSTIATGAVHVLEAEVVTTVTAPTPKPAPIQPKKPVKLVPREPDSNDSFPQSGSPVGTRTRGSNSDADGLPNSDDDTRSRSRETEAGLATRRRQAKTRLAEKKRKKKLNWVPFAAVGGVVALLAVVAAVIFLRPPKPTAPPVDNANNTVPPPVAKHVLPPAWVNVPDNATVFVVAHPEAYWLAAQSHIRPQSRFVKVLNDLTSRYRFDLRHGERFTFANLGDRTGRGVATAEGAFLTPEWVGQTATWPGGKVQVLDGQKFLTFPPNGDWTMHGVISPRPAYTISNNEGLIVELARRNATQKPKLADGMLTAITEPDNPNPPTFTFAASGGWQFGDGSTLGDLGAELVIIQARLVGDRFDVDVDIRGTSPDRVKEFVNVALWDRVKKSCPGLKPYLQAITENTSNDGWDKVGNLHRLRKTEAGAWPVDNAHVWLERLLPD
ncbi:serine/threonine protein kinase [Limnoglobus roseus]|uniref:Serine/threonine protein kinase n=1 Tax=Limnoglobus roseus TaxID=2598579 RepID=A0A5C1AH75_9BACT|nr:serine/threonine-protein kinase [Limnoglobus roseus]QEL17092.1 serine/threonine protein kinase [Limnoglobus roseus]